MHQRSENVRGNALSSGGVNGGWQLDFHFFCLGLFICSWFPIRTRCRLTLAAFTRPEENNGEGHSATVKGFLIACRVGVQQAWEASGLEWGAEVLCCASWYQSLTSGAGGRCIYFPVSFYKEARFVFVSSPYLPTLGCEKEGDFWGYRQMAYITLIQILKEKNTEQAATSKALSRF